MDASKFPTENRRENMEALRSVGGSIQRKPLADCTNTVSRSSQQPSSSIKYSNPSLTSSLKRIIDQTKLKEKINHADKPVAASGSVSRSLVSNVRPVTRRLSTDLGFPRLVDQPTLKEKINDVNSSDGGSGAASRSLATNVRPVTRRMAANLDFPASAPPPTRPPNLLPDEGVSEKEFDAPYSVYTVRKKTSGKKRNKDESSYSAVARLRLDLTPNSGKKKHPANENKPKPLKMTPNKKQRTVKHEKDNMVHRSPQEYIEQQRAYFAEVDAFELEEEEVTSTSDLD